MKIEIIPCLNDNYSYLIFEKKTNTVSIIDPSDFATVDNVVRKYKKLDNILNTHHHLDHVGGNIELKNKYNSKIFGFRNDKKRIPGIDILLEEEKKYKIGDLEFNIIFVPGHTSGHIVFYFEKEKTCFTGDTLFSLGCGRVFEGDHEEMLNSLNKLKSLPLSTKIYCGHEYTKKNLDFCLKYDSQNIHLNQKAKIISSKVQNNLPTIPSFLSEELESNIFLRCDNKGLKKTLNLDDCSDLEIFTKLRDLKDTF